VWLSDALADALDDAEVDGAGVLDVAGAPVVTARPAPVLAEDEHAASAVPSTARVSAAAVSAAGRARRVRAMPVMMPGAGAIRSTARQDRR
jgi:hypothetical protein